MPLVMAASYPEKRKRALPAFAQRPRPQRFVLLRFRDGAFERRAGLGEALALAGVLPLAGVLRALARALAFARVSARANHRRGSRCRHEGGCREYRGRRADDEFPVHRDAPCLPRPCFLTYPRDVKL